MIARKVQQLIMDVAQEIAAAQIGPAVLSHQDKTEDVLHVILVAVQKYPVHRIPIILKIKKAQRLVIVANNV